MTEMLKPCPFCGSANLKVFTNLVECRNQDCGAVGPDLGHFVQPPPYPAARAAWNRRAPVREDIAEGLAEALQSVRSIAADWAVAHGCHDCDRVIAAMQQATAALAAYEDRT